MTTTNPHLVRAGTGDGQWSQHRPGLHPLTRPSDSFARFLFGVLLFPLFARVGGWDRGTGLLDGLTGLAGAALRGDGRCCLGAHRDEVARSLHAWRLMSGTRRSTRTRPTSLVWWARRWMLVQGEGSLQTGHMKIKFFSEHSRW